MMKYDKTLHTEFLKLNEKMDKAMKIAISKMCLYIVIMLYISFTSDFEKSVYNGFKPHLIWYTITIIPITVIACIILSIKNAKIIRKITSVQLKIKEISGDVSNKYFEGFNQLNDIIPKVSKAEKGEQCFKQLIKNVEKSVSTLPKAYQDEARYVYLKNWFEHKCVEQEQKN